MRKSLVVVGVSVIICAAFLGAAHIVSNTAISIKNKGYVEVKGFAKQEIVSDRGIIEATIVAEEIDLKTCYAKLSEDKKKVLAFLKETFSVEQDEVELTPANIREIYTINERGHTTNELAKYILRQNVRITSNDVKKIAKVSAKFIDVLDKGVKIEINYPQYIYTQLDDLKIEMIGRATSNARERALKIAKQGKFGLGSISSVRVGVFQITPLYSTEVAGYGINDTSSIKKEIKSVVDIKYFVK